MVTPSRKSIRLTFRVTGDQIELIKHERLPMITPPSVGEPPEIGKYGGFWVELRNVNDRVLFHRPLHSPLGDSVDVHSPDGTIRREFGPAEESTFEVLVPDYDEDLSVSLVGEYLDADKFRRERAAQPEEAAPASRELARFDIPKEGTPPQEVQHERE